MNNRQYLKILSDEDLAKFLCHVAQSGKLTMDDIDEVLEIYKNSNPPDFESMLAWLRSPTK